jgi:pimeloyl-ACP methyl ester carboxylesterase
LPVVFVNGGPGYGTTEIAAAYQRSSARRTRPIILFDQRGTGASRPSLACPETAALSYAELGAVTGDATTRARIVRAVDTCHDRLVDSGVDLARYDGAALAADAVDVPRALGYDRFDVEAVSYGTRTALTMLRDHPRGVRAVVLDATLPPGADFVGGTYRAAQDALDRLFADCPAGCDGPALRARYLAVLNRLEATPATVTVRASSGADVRVVFDGRRVAELVFFAISQPGLYALVPNLITALEAGQFAFVASLVVPRFASDALPERGAYLSALCRDGLPIARRTPPRRFAYGDVLAGALTARIDALAAECAVWDVGAAPRRSHRKVQSRRPVLLLHGDLDFTTPLAGARRAARSLKHAQLVVFPGRGHGVFVLQPDDPCVVGLRNAFLAAPRAPLRTACVR